MANLGYLSTNFWKNKKVLITGHSGFKGSWLTHFVLNLDAQILGLSLDKIELNHKNFTQEILDIREPKKLSKVIKDFQPNIIVHLAAQAFVSEGYRSPIDTLHTNTIGTANILESSRSIDSLSAILIVTTDKVYEDPAIYKPNSRDKFELGHSVDDPLGANEIYGASKASAEIITHAYRESFFRQIHGDSRKSVGIATARAGNVLGPNDWGVNRLVPDFFRSHKSSNSLKLRNPTSVRPWQHIYDLCIGYLLLIQNLSENPIKFSKAWNFGNKNTQCDVRTLVSILNEQLTFRGELNVPLEVIAENENFQERKFLRINCDDTEKHLAWMPKFNLESIAENLVDGFLLKNTNLSKFTVETSQSFINKYII